MDANIQRMLSEKLYDKRKSGALEIEDLIRKSLNDGNQERIDKIVHQLCHDYAYAVHQPHARNGGLIGLAAAAIALGPQVARYMREIMPPVLACFYDQDARVRYYACEAMYNIAKVAKGELLPYFNHMFDALSRLAADTELSVKNGSELLDRLVKDIVAEAAATYATIVYSEPVVIDSNAETGQEGGGMTTAFSLPKFIPLLEERLNVLNPFTRTFLVSWITLLDSVPDLEIVAYLPRFLGGLLKFLSDPNQEVRTTTRSALDRFLSEIRKIAAVKKGIAESRRSKENGRRYSGDSDAAVSDSPEPEATEAERPGEEPLPPSDEAQTNQDQKSGQETEGMTTLAAVEAERRNQENDEKDDDDEDDDFFDNEWIPGQGVHIAYQDILDILVTFLSESREEEVQITTLRWIESFMDICPEDILVFTPRLLAQVLPALSHNVDNVKQAANRVNQALMAYIMSLPEEPARPRPESDQLLAGASQSTGSLPAANAAASRAVNGTERQSNISLPAKPSARRVASPDGGSSMVKTPEARTPEPPLDEGTDSNSSPHADLDYEAAVNALTLQFLHEHEATRVAALAWLIMLHRKSPRKILAIQDATFPALLKTLSDPAESVVTRDLLLLSQISKSSDDSYFYSFMVNLLKLFCTDRRLLETRGNLIIRQLCMTLPAEKIYRTMADCLEKDEDDIEFASIMVQNLNNNLITAPELKDLRKRLRNLDSKDGQTIFTVLFRAWCVNAVATFSLCLLAQAYEQAYNLLQIFADLEMTVNMLIQIDKLVQLLESPVFTYLRMQLLEPERYPHLYKCMYGVLMLLPQSSAFAALKNRLNSVSAIGYLHSAPRTASASATPSSVSTFERQNRLKSREEGGIRWNELLEKFRHTQDRLRRAQHRQLSIQHGLDPDTEVPGASMPEKTARQPALTIVTPSDAAKAGSAPPGVSAVASAGASAGERPPSSQSLGRPALQPPQTPSTPAAGHVRARSGLSQLRGLAKVGKKDKDKDKK